MLRVTKEVVQVLVVVIPGAITRNNTFQRTWIAFFSRMWRVILIVIPEVVLVAIPGVIT